MLVILNVYFVTVPCFFFFFFFLYGIGLNRPFGRETMEEHQPIMAQSHSVFNQLLDLLLPLVHPNTREEK